MVSDDFPIDHFATFIDVVRTQAERYGEQNLYRFLRDGDVDGTVDSLSFGALDRRARAIGARLRAERGVAERALLLYPPGLDYVTAFFGCLLGGTIAVPAYPPDPTRLDRTLPRLRAIVRDCGAKFVLTTSAIAALAEALTATAPDLARLRWIATDTIADEEASRWRAPDCTAESLAFLQYTSGSTGAPRGVMVTHRNLLANSAHIAAATGRSLSTVGVLWLPPYHDMGLIGGIVQPLYIARPVVLMSPVAFLQRPARWLQAISRFRATISAGPDFALALCCRKVSPEERAALDLSSCDIIFDGAEPIRGETIDRFMEVFRPAGLRPQVIHPCYGLAESTLIVSGAHRPRPLVKLAVQAAEMARDRVVLAQDPADARTLIGCGRPAQQVLIVHPETRLALDSGEVGEIWVRGASVATGYWGNQEESELAFAARLADSGEGPYLRTGDLGFLHDGELFVTGRLKDLLILHGKNHYPQDLERTIERAHPAIRPGAVAAFAVEHAGEEALAVVAEVDLRRGNVTPGAVIAAIKEAVLTEHEVRAERVVLLPPGRIPKTSSGKLQRRTCRDELLAGRLEVLASYPTLAAPAAAPIAAATDLYPRLDEIADRVDMRSTRYRFDLETSVAWNRLNEPGDYLPPGLADFFGVDVPALQRVPGAWETFQWAAALATCDSFIETEEMVTHFIRAGRAALGGRRSLTLLEEEEDKHILLFRRYADHLRAERPELALAYQSRYTSMFLDMPYQDSVEFHYTVWVNILFFEEYTIWIHDRLRAESAAVQPAWLSAHAAHAREELQHVVTDHAWLWALGATAAQREAWSKRLFGEIISIVSNFAMPVENLLGLCEEQFPELQGMTATRRRRGPSFLALIQDRAFRRTREAAPYFAQIVKSAGTAQPVMRSERVSRAVTHAEVVDWLCAWLGTKLRVDAAAVDRRATFTQHGLDSVAAISLSGELEAWLGCRLSATLAYDYPTVDLVAQAVAAAVSGLSERTSGSDVTASAEPGHFASARQTRLWFLEQTFPGAILDHLTTVYELRGALDVDLLHGALQALAARHPALRTTFRESSGRVEQVVGPVATIDLQLLESSEAEMLQQARQRAATLDTAPFDLSRGPLLRIELVRGSATRSALVLAMHHITTDGWSMGILLSELTTLYQALTRAAPSPLLPVGTDPVDLARQEEALLRSAEGKRRLSFWRDKLTSHPQLARASRGPTFQGESMQRTVPSTTLAAWKAYADRQGVTLYLTLLAALHVALRDRTGEQDILLNTHLLDRASDESKSVAGYLVNLLTLRTELLHAGGLDEVLVQVKRSWLEALANELPIDHVVRSLWPARYATRWMPAPLAFNLLPWPYPKLGDDTLRLERLAAAMPTPSFLFFDQMLVAQPTEDGLAFTLWYERGTWTQTEAAALLDEFFGVLGIATSSPQQGYGQEVP